MSVVDNSPKIHPFFETQMKSIDGHLMPIIQTGGMTLRQYYAGQCLASVGMLFQPEIGRLPVEKIVKLCVQIADAMVEELG